MLPLLTVSNILRKDSKGDIVYVNPEMESTLADVRAEPVKCVTVKKGLVVEESCFTVQQE